MDLYFYAATRSSPLSWVYSNPISKVKNLVKYCPSITERKWALNQSVMLLNTNSKEPCSGRHSFLEKPLSHVWKAQTYVEVNNKWIPMGTWIP